MKQSDIIFFYPQMLCLHVLSSLKINSPETFELAKKAIIALLAKIPIDEDGIVFSGPPSSPLINYLTQEDIDFPVVKVSNKDIYFKQITEIYISIFDFTIKNYDKLDSEVQDSLILIYNDRFPTFGARQTPNPVTESYLMYNEWDKLTPLIQIKEEEDYILKLKIHEESQNEFNQKKEIKLLAKSKSYDNQKNKKS